MVDCFFLKTPHAIYQTEQNAIQSLPNANDANA